MLAVSADVIVHFSTESAQKGFFLYCPHSSGKFSHTRRSRFLFQPSFIYDITPRAAAIAVENAICRLYPPV